MEYVLQAFSCPISVTRIANIHYFELKNRYYPVRNSHNFRELLYVDNGCITVDADTYSGEVEENQLIIHRANESHLHSYPQDASANIILIGFECLCPELDFFSVSPVTLNDFQKKLLTEIIKEGRTVFLPPYDVPNQTMSKRKDFPFGSDQLIRLKLESLFIELIRSKNNITDEENSNIDDDKFQEIYEYINNNYRNRIRLSELCFMYGTNKTTLCNKFHTLYGQTIISYINKLRITEAKKLLREGNLNTTQIAEYVGFSSVHYFSRIFKQHEHRSPSDYIKSKKLDKTSNK